MSNMDDVSEIRSQAPLEDPTADFNSVAQHSKQDIMAESKGLSNENFHSQPGGEAGDGVYIGKLLDADEDHFN